jgi:hypothetical protein
VGAMPVVSMGPDWKVCGALVCGVVGFGVGPLPETGLDEAFGLAVGAGRVRLRAYVLEAELPACVAEGEGFVARAVGGHDAPDG